MGLKFAVAGKGGVGKTTIAGLLAREWGRDGKRVFAIDADPGGQLATVLGVPGDRRPRPIAELSDLIRERTGVDPSESYGQLFRLNPQVDDIPDRYSSAGEDGTRLLVLGGITKPGSGCYCPQSALLKSLISHLVLDREDYVLLDMEAGLEHLGRGIARHVDALLIVMDPGRRAVEMATAISALAKGLEVPRRFGILNKSTEAGDVAEVSRQLAESSDLTLLQTIPYDPLFVRADRDGRSPAAYAERTAGLEAIRALRTNLEAFAA